MVECGKPDCERVVPPPSWPGFVKEVGAEDAVIDGWSLGGHLAIEAAEPTGGRSCRIRR
jgi:hypothetical protein